MRKELIGGNRMKKEEILQLSFIDDKEKMEDFKNLTKEEFLFSYSYLTEKEYEATMLHCNLLQEKN